MASRNIYFDDKDLEQFAPSVQEALHRLSRQQEAILAREKMPYQGERLKIVDPGMTEAEYRKKVASQTGEDNHRMGVDLAEGTMPWRDDPNGGSK